MLLQFHNGTYVTNFTPESDTEEIDKAAVTAAQLLSKKLQVGFGVGVVLRCCCWGLDLSRAFW